jgi:hypothetical protein
MITLPEMPPSIAKLPRDDRGYPCPWFISWIDGKPEFRAMDGAKLRLAIRDKLCWVCGERLEPKTMTFVIGPMCSVNKISAEPPSHRVCAEFSAKGCPFLSKPKAVRRLAGLPECAENPAGVMIERNPGVTCLWHCGGYEIIQHGTGILFRIANPSQVHWYCEGRLATRAEIMESIETGLPLLQKMAESQGADAIRELGWAVDRAMKFVPKE